jgi:hypothetical protein
MVKQGTGTIGETNQQQKASFSSTLNERHVHLPTSGSVRLKTDRHGKAEKAPLSTSSALFLASKGFDELPHLFDSTESFRLLRHQY